MPTHMLGSKALRIIMRIKKSSLVFFILFLFLIQVNNVLGENSVINNKKGINTRSASPCPANSEGKVIASKQFKGKLDGFSSESYLYGDVSGKHKEFRSFRLGNEDSCYLALHKLEELEINYDVVCELYGDGTGIYPYSVITQIRAHNDDLKSWKKKFDFSKNGESCKKEVEKYTRDTVTE